MSDSEDLDSDIDDGMDLGATAGGTGEAIDEDMLLNSDNDSVSGDDDGSGSVNDNDKDDDDDDDDDEDEDNETRLMNKYAEILGRIMEDKYNYDNYTELVELAHEISDLDKIRESCELFSSAYPLAPNIWLRWLKIELNIATSDVENKKVNQLFRRAFSDYFCSTLAAEYANLAAKSANSEEIWAEILSTYTLHCMKGRALFEAWRTHFQASEPESPEKYQKIIEMYERELSLPLYDMEETYIEFKVLCEKNKDKFANVEWSRIDDKYNRAKEKLQKILPFEKKLDALDPRSHQDRATVYQQYIAECQSFLSEQMIQVLYERMVTDCCLNANCWLNYVKYIQSRSDEPSPEVAAVFSQTDLDIVNRAIRNCTWSADIYVEKMRIAEKMELPKQELQNIAEFALAAGFQSPEPLVTIWLEYLSYLRRNTNYSVDKEVEILRATFELAWDTLGRQFGVLADSSCEILQMWGRLEYGPLSDLLKGKELWTTVMESADNPSKSGMWIEFAHLEMRRGVDGARKVYRKAIAAPDIDSLDVVVASWIRFERCNGTLEQLKACQEHCWQVQSQAQKSSQNPFNNRNKLPARDGKKPFDKNKKPFEKKPAAASDRKGQKRNAPKAAGKPDEKVFVIRKHKGDADDAAVPSKRQKMDSSSGQRASNSGQSHSDLTSDPAKDIVMVFLSNLSYEVTSEQIIAAFPELHIQSVDLIKSANGKNRGFGYVELLSPREVTLALTFDRRLINERPVFISNVLRDKEKRGSFKYAESLEPTKLFVKGLPYDATKEELEQLFGEFGGIKDTRLVCHKNGKSKGIAYVEFEKETSSSRAVLKMDQFVLRDHTISVAISAPPPKQSKPDVAAQNLVGLGQGRRGNIPKGDQKPRLSFIPRSVQKAVQGSTSSANGDGTTSAAGAKSNDDFRKLLQKQ